MTPKEADVALDTLRKFLGNFIPLLFNAIGGASPHHAALLHTLLRFGGGREAGRGKGVLYSFLISFFLLFFFFFFFFFLSLFF